MYDIEKLYQAKDIGDAIRALKEDPEAVVISGGSDVLIKVREGKLAGCSLVSIHGIKELEGVRMEEDGTIVIGPATTFSHVTNNRIIQKYIPILGDAVDQAGGPQLRNIGTVGGNVCNGVTSADSASSFCCLDAVLVVEGPEGVREIPIDLHCRSKPPFQTDIPGKMEEEEDQHPRLPDYQHHKQQDRSQGLRFESAGLLPSPQETSPGTGESTPPCRCSPRIRKGSAHSTPPPAR